MAQQTRDEAEKHFAWAEANMELSGFDPCSNPLYQKLKARILAGEITARQACDEVLSKCVDPSVGSKDTA